MARQSVSRIHRVQLDQQAVAMHLGQHARCGNRVAGPVAVNDGLLRTGPVDGVAAVDHQIVRLDRELLDGDTHGQQRSPADVDAVDRFHIHGGDGKRQSLGANHDVEFVALVFTELL